MVIKNGTPAVSATSDAGMGAAIIETTPGIIGITNLVANILNQFTDPATVVIDPQTGKIHASSNSTSRTALAAAISAAESDALNLTPDAGQTGRSLAFTADGALANILTTDLTTAVKPKMSLESLVSRLLSKIQEAEAATPANVGRYLLSVNQSTKTVTIHLLVDDGASGRAALDAVTLTAAQSVRLAVTPEDSETVTSALPFEGGAV